jgi:hypothetical protein
MQKKEKKGIHYLKVYHFKENKLGKMIYPWYIQVKLDFLENFCQGFTKNLNFFKIFFLITGGYLIHLIARRPAGS